MRISKIAYRYSRTVNLGNYESAKIEVELEAELDDTDDAQACRRQLADETKASVREQLAPLSKLRVEQIKEVAAGLPPDLRAGLIANLNGSNHGN